MTTLNWSQACKDAVKAVRDDASGVTFASITYEDGSNDAMTVLASGGGDGDSVAALLAQNADKVVFTLLRTTEKIDESITTKFVFVNFAGAQTRRMLLARQSVHAGAVLDFFSPYHVDLKTDSSAEVSAQIIADLVAFASGQKSHVRAADGSTAAAPKPAAAPTPAPTPAAAAAPAATAAAAAAPKPVVAKPKAAVVVKTGGNEGARSKTGIPIEDEAALTAAIAAVRSNANGTNWLLATYVPGAKPDTLKLAASGSGGVAELLSHLTDDNVYYGLTRHVEVIDKSETVKFAHVALNAPNAPRMLRARIGTHKGAVEAIFHPYHIDLITDEKADITEQVLLDRIAQASGTKSNVK